MEEAVSVQSVLKMQQQLETARQGAIKQLLGSIDEAKKGLKALGYDETSVQPKQKVKAPKPCPRCNATDHDARFHRGDAKKVDDASAV